MQQGSTHFIDKIMADDLATGRHVGQIRTRFPPEPNGYLHIGHAKSICLNFSLAKAHQGVCHLRFDDTNPEKESDEYIKAIQADVRWLGFDWGERAFFTSDYFARLYAWAVDLIRQGKAYVDSMNADEIRDHRGTLTAPGKNSPYRNRSVAENLALFERMRGGEFADGEHVLRAKIDMASPNITLRDPVLYRIRHRHHHRTGDAWCIYPMYDFSHCLSDALEHISHSLCTLEFEDHRPLYDWCIENLNTPSRPHQYEFARLNLDYTVLSKRKLIALVNDGAVDGWDDPRMPTISGLRRRGYTPESIRNFCGRIGITKDDARIDMALLEYCLRDDLGERVPRGLCVLRPLKVVIENYPDDKEEWFTAPNHPQQPDFGSRRIPFGKVLYIEQEDFMFDAPKKFFRLSPGREVRFKYAYLVTCTDAIKDERTGEVVELRCTYDPDSAGGNAPDGRKVKGTVHWVSAQHAKTAEVRLYDRLFKVADPERADGHWKDSLNPDSVTVISDALIEPLLAQAAPEARYQFERLGYFCADRWDHSADTPVFNRTVTLRDTQAKAAARPACVL